MVDETSAKQGRGGRRTLGVLEWSLGLVVLCFAALLIVAISTTRQPARDGGQAARPHVQQTAPGPNPPSRR